MAIRPIVVAGLFAAAATPLAAQEWSGTLTLYGWLPVIEGAQKGPGGQPIVDLDAEDVLQALDLALFATGQVHRDRFGVMFDVAYTDLSSDAKAKAPFTARASVGTTVWFATLAGTYRLQGDDATFVDLYAGARYFDASADLEVSLLGGNVRRTVNADADWIDPIVGVQGRYPFAERWSLYGFGDVGGFGVGSDLTWQAYTGVNYAFNEAFAGNLGFRYMSIDYDDDVTIDIELYGPIFGVTYRF